MKRYDLGEGVFGCGEDPPTEQDLAVIERFKQYLRGELSLQEARKYTCLSLEQAAEMIGVEPVRLAAIEAGSEVVDSSLLARMKKIYGPNCLLSPRGSA